MSSGRLGRLTDLVKMMAATAATKSRSHHQSKIQAHTLWRKSIAAPYMSSLSPCLGRALVFVERSI